MEALLEALAVDHVGIAAGAPGTGLTRLLGAAAVPGKEMPSGVAVGRFGPERGLELVWEAREGSPVAGFLRRRGPGLHHVALRVAAPIEAVRERLSEESVRLVGEEIERSSDGRKCFFIHPEATDGVLIEIVEGEAG
ncbi:MAG: hypothetical protein U0R71_14920 [Solirubrobacterales bacterium]